ncbi:alpha/beta hydrolase [Variovorax sp. ZS18.2.2]|uniref:alpha/beta hydrolase n=1 Tax=Variovorax sp. ZS18.2.2 TaxID=2971255 RepID=UPI0021513EDA|nr:alpha/beta hydrolase [Variovorax sp. ZS18.2.2]MCR6476036.1 alpha/beta hydrolase [Variovorax sp. ZS18.2.2]
MHSARLTLLALATSLVIASCGGGGGGNGFSFTPLPPASESNPPAPVPEPPAPPAPEPEETRLQDSRNDFAPADPTATTFPALQADASDKVDNATTSRWAGMLGGAQYHVEVPANWNGQLVMWGHGYAGTGKELKVDDPSIRRHLIQNGYAWAASSFSKNYYDLRVAVEDTNALALAFSQIAKANGRDLAAPSKLFISGGSFGGSLAATAVEDETYATANHKVKYNGALPMCGALGDTELFDYFAGLQVTAQALAGLPKYPRANWADIQAQVTSALFTQFSPLGIAPTPAGEKYASVIQNLSGGPRPLFDLAFTAGGSLMAPWTVAFVVDDIADGVLNKNVTDTTRFTYTIDGDPAGSAALNASALKISAVPDANRLRRDGLRWIPKINGEFKVPVLTLHTLGDLFVPFSMEQIYNRRVAAKGNGQWLVQRAVRGISHCDFTQKEATEAFDALVKWERDGVKPAGDDVVTPAVVADPAYGCTFTRPADMADDSGLIKLGRMLAGSKPCPT